MIKRTAVERCPLFSIETGFYLKAPGILFVIERKKKQMNHETIQNYNLQQFLKKFKHVRLASIVKNGWRKWSLQHV